MTEDRDRMLKCEQCGCHFYEMTTSYVAVFEPVEPNDPYSISKRVYIEWTCLFNRLARWPKDPNKYKIM